MWLIEGVLMITELETLIAARFPLLYIISAEEKPAEELLLELAQKKKAQIYFWDFSRGWADKEGADKGNPMNALSRVHKAPKDQSVLFVLKDIATLIAPGSNGQITSAQLPLVRELKNLAQELSQDRRCIVLLSDQLRLPGELREETTVIDIPLPTASQISELLNQLVGRKLKLDASGREQLIKACRGLSRCRISRVLAKCLASSGKVDESAIAIVISEKRQAVRETGILEFISVQSGLESVGGLENLKQWVRVRSRSFSDEAAAYGLPSPKGVLLAGIQGTGKSLSAKTIAAEWQLPLLRLDVGRLFGGIVGESESRIRQVIKLAEAISPCVLWIDEADKAFGNITNGNDGDSGISRRVFGSLITWMQEKTAPVFVVLTANNIEILPAEFLRKGRLDEIFWLNLPTVKERLQIFRVHLKRLRPKRDDFDFELLASRSEEFSGAEIEQVIYEAMQQGFSRGEEFTMGDLLDAIAQTVPLAKIMAHQIEELKAWAIRSGAKSASVEGQGAREEERGLSLLEVDDLNSSN